MRSLVFSLGLLVSGPALAIDVNVTGACPGAALVEITGVTPGGTVAILKGRGPGLDVMPAGPCAGGSSGLSGLSYVTSLRDTDRDGRITVSPTLPGAVCGQYIQALDASTCTQSGLELLGGGEESPMVLTPDSGSVVPGEDPYWADKGYAFTALTDFSITGGAWLLNLPLGGEVRLSVYDGSSLALLARGSTAVGMGVEDWYRSDLDYDFRAGGYYLVTFYTDRAGSATFTRKDSPSYGYAVDGLVTGVTGWSSYNSGDFAPEGTGAGGYLGNSWAPYQELYVLD